MNRGMFGFMKGFPLYQSGEKTWHVTVDKVNFFWYELIMGEPQVPGIDDPVGDYLRSYKKVIDETLEKHFIYFIVTRPKIRIDITRPLKWADESNELTIPILIGRDRRHDSFTIEVNLEGIKKNERPNVSATDTCVTFDLGSVRAVMSVHDLLQQCREGLQFQTKVQYVGKTKNPAQRLTEGTHASLAKIHYRLGEENDLFLRVHTMKVGLKVSTPGIHIVTANSMVDEIDIKDENGVIECALIKYFNSQMQQDNVEKEAGELRNQLRTMRDDHRITRLIVDLDLDVPNSYDCLFSDSTEKAWRHVFECSLEDGEYKIIRLPEDVNPTTFYMDE